MMSKRFAAAFVVAATVLGACGGSGGGANAATFTDGLQDACRTMDKDLEALDQPAEVAEFEDAADSASRIIEDGVADIKKLNAPKAQAGDADDLISNFEDQIDLLDQISTAARNGDEDTVASKIESLNKLTSKNEGLADDLDASKCALDPIFSDTPAPPATDPPGTDPPVTDPPVTDPPVTEPPTTAAPATDPSTTAPPAANSNKRIFDASTELTASGAITFVPAPDNTVNLWQGFLDQSSVINPQPGNISGVDVRENGVGIGRVFIYIADSPLAPNSVEDLIPIVSAGAISIADTADGIPGISYVISDGTNFFLAAFEGFIVWVVSPTRPGIETTMTDFVNALP